MSSIPGRQVCTSITLDADAFRYLQEFATHGKAYGNFVSLLLHKEALRRELQERPSLPPIQAGKDRP